MSDERDGAVVRVASMRYWRAVDARVVVEAWGESGEALGEFARRYGIGLGRLRRWVSRLEGAGEGVGFHPVRLVRREQGDWGRGEPLEVVVGHGCLVRVRPGFAAADLERLLGVLAGGGFC